jgi:hypothetical protein
VLGGHQRAHVERRAHDLAPAAYEALAFPLTRLARPWRKARERGGVAATERAQLGHFRQQGTRYDGADAGGVAMPAYSHLLDEERDQIAVMRAAGRLIGAIALGQTPHRSSRAWLLGSFGTESLVETLIVWPLPVVSLRASPWGQVRQIKISWRSAFACAGPHR